MRLFLVLHLNSAVFYDKGYASLRAARRNACRSYKVSFRVWVSHPIKPPSRQSCETVARVLSVIELIAKIFGAVSRTISLMRLSALLAIKRCRCRDDGFCSGFAFRNYSLLIIHYSFKSRHYNDGFCHLTMLPFLAD